MADYEWVEGTVEVASNKRPPGGVKIAGYENWFNVSKYEKPTPTLPERGDKVRLGVGQDGYVRKIEIVQAANPRPAGPSGSSGSGSSGEAELSPARIRLEAIRIAADFVTAQPAGLSGHVAILAANWAKFVMTGEVQQLPQSAQHGRPAQSAPPSTQTPTPATNGTKPSEPAESFAPA